MLKNIKKSNKGFTIIEVLIVLAIAGLIMLIVFLAVPALQRNSRNTQRKNDVGQMLGAVQEYTNNNGGTAPSAVTLIGGNQWYFCTTSPCVASGGTSATNGSPSKAGYFTTSSATAGVTIAASVPATAPNNDQVFIVKGAVCSSNAPTATGANTRSVAAWWTSEPAVSQCQES